MTGAWTGESILAYTHPSVAISPSICGNALQSRPGGRASYSKHCRTLTPTLSRSRPRSNGATQTFRRPSLATGSSHNQRENSVNHASNSSSNPGVYVPPHLNSNYQSSLRNGTFSDTRYSKDQLLDMFRRQGESGGLGKNLSSLMVGGWDPGMSNDGGSGTWNRREDPKEGAPGPEICWDAEGTVQPLGLVDMSDEEKEVCCWSMDLFDAC